jgi:hypothetical protein
MLSEFSHRVRDGSALFVSEAHKEVKIVGIGNTSQLPHQGSARISQDQCLPADSAVQVCVAPNPFLQDGS